MHLNCHSWLELSIELLIKRKLLSPFIHAWTNKALLRIHITDLMRVVLAIVKWKQIKMKKWNLTAKMGAMYKWQGRHPETIQVYEARQDLPHGLLQEQHAFKTSSMSGSSPASSSYTHNSRNDIRKMWTPLPWMWICHEYILIDGEPSSSYQGESII